MFLNLRRQTGTNIRLFPAGLLNLRQGFSAHRFGQVIQERRVIQTESFLTSAAEKKSPPSSTRSKGY